MAQAKKIFIAATRQNDGKTVFSIGLILALKKRFGRVGFMKPVGQKYLIVDGIKVDKDAVLMQKVCGMDSDLKSLNPVAVEEGFTRKYLDAPSDNALSQRIRDGYKNVAQGKDAVVIEGTGHAGVGSVFDMSNAEVARILDTPVIIMSIGGIGRPIDEVCLNLSLFREKGVEVTGVVINKVIPEKRPIVENYVRKGLDRLGVKLLGVLPFSPTLLQPDLYQICECINGKVIAGYDNFHLKIKNIVIGAMTARHALDYFKPSSLLVTPGDREDLILAALESYSENDVQGVVLTGGLYPHKSILDLIKKYNIPTMIVSEGTYETASSIHELVVKITEKDAEKVEVAQKLVEENVDIDELFK